MRIHLAADKTNGLCSNLCDAKDDAATGRRLQFRQLIKKLGQRKETRMRKKKQQELRLEERAVMSHSHYKKRRKYNHL